MNELFEIENVKIPIFYYLNRTSFFISALKSPQAFFCDVFNAPLNGLIKKHYGYSLTPYNRKFKNKEFKFYKRIFTTREGIVFFELPLPKLIKDGKNAPYYKMYCIPYLDDGKRIEPLDLYALQPYSKKNGCYTLYKIEPRKGKFSPFRSAVSTLPLDFNDPRSLEYIYQQIFFKIS